MVMVTSADGHPGLDDVFFDVLLVGDGLVLSPFDHLDGDGDGSLRNAE